MSLAPGVKIPSFDNTLGALFIGANIATILYGVICLQTFLYVTSAHSQKDRWWLKSLVFLLFTLDSAHQLALTASIYKFLVSDFLKPALISSYGAGSGDEYAVASSCMEAILIVLIQLFFCWRLWVVSMASLRIEYRLLFTGLTVSLALLSFASSMDSAIAGFNLHVLPLSSPNYNLAYKLSASTRVSFDVMVTIAMTISLHRARSSSSDVQFPRSEHVITLLTLITVNTNLITTCLSISELVTFLTLPDTGVYGGIAFLSAKSYLNSFLAVLNSRAYLREKFFDNTPALKVLRRNGRSAYAIPPDDKHSPVTSTTRESSSFQLSTFNMNSKPNASDSDIYGVNTQV